MKEKVLTLCLALLLLAAFAVPVSADDFEYIYDPDGFFSDDELQSLNNSAAAFYEQNGTRILFAITDVDSLDENTLYDEMNPGNEPGLLIYADLVVGSYRSVSAGLSDDFMDKYADALFTILNETDTWYEGALGYINAAGMLTTDDYGADPADEAVPADTLIAPAPTAEPMPFTLLMDEADLLTDSEEDSLRTQLAALSEKCGRDITVVTVPDMGSFIDPEEFCDYYFETHDYAPDTVMLMVTMETREYRLSVYGNCRNAFPAAQREAICETVVSYLSDGDYAGAFRSFAEACDTYTAYYDTEGEVYEPPLPVYWIFVCLGIGLAVGLTVTLIMKRRLRSVHFQSSAADYAGSLALTRSHEHFLYSHIDRRAIPKNNSSGGGGGVSSSGHSSGGHF